MGRGPDMSVHLGDGWAVIEDNGDRVYMEDRHIAGAEVSSGILLFGVFDGHNGSVVADYCRDRITAHIRTELADKRHRQHSLPVEHALAAAVEKLDLVGEGDVSLPRDTGSTACMVMLTLEDAWFVNVGDSRAILRMRGRVLQMSVDHKPMLRSESERVLRHGGFVSNTDGSWRVNGRLNLSRSIGDWSMRPFIIPTPMIKHHPRKAKPQLQDPGKRTQEDEYIVLATDGLYDVMTNEAIIAVIDSHPHTRDGITRALRELVATSRDRKSGDNITVMYIGLSVHKDGSRSRRRFPSSSQQHVVR